APLSLHLTLQRLRVRRRRGVLPRRADAGSSERGGATLPSPEPEQRTAGAGATMSPIVLHAVLAGLAICALGAQMRYRIPGHSVFLVLPWLGPAVACLGPILLVNAVIVQINTSGFTIQRVERWALALAFAVGGLSFVSP